MHYAILFEKKCLVWYIKSISLFFFQENLNGNSYLNFLEKSFREYLDNMALQERHNFWFQRDGCPVIETNCIQISTLQ